MAEGGADFTNGFRALCDAAEGADDRVHTELGESAAVGDWLRRWHERLAGEAAEPAARAAAMRRANPAVIPRNHRVEAALDAAVDGDLGPMEDLLQVVASSWEEHPEGVPYRSPPQPHEVVRQTFCGT